MTADTSAQKTAPCATATETTGSDAAALRGFVIVAGILSAILFVAIGLAYGLQKYGDGSLFSYAVAVQDAWAYHWHNISGRIFVYLFASLPAETFVGLSGNAESGIIVYGFLFFVAQALGLFAAYAADRSRGRLLFATACASTALLCPLVFGAPTEMWMAHALFWPTLALCHYARRALVGTALVFVAMLALVFTHEGAVILEICILCTLALRGLRDPSFLRALGIFIVVMAAWFVVRRELPPDAYDSAVLARAAWDFFDLSLIESAMFIVLIVALVGYALVYFLLRLWTPTKAHLVAAAIAALALAVYWLRFDTALHAENRYYMRTALLIGTLAFGTWAAAQAVAAEDALHLPIPLLGRVLALLQNAATARALCGALIVVMLVHVVETAKFVRGWRDYENAVRALALGDASDPALGDPRFISSARIGADLNRLAWFSTTPFLSVLMAPDFRPARLVMDPRDPRVNYFWLSCATATANAQAKRAVPVETRRLIRVFSCQHR